MSETANGQELDVTSPAVRDAVAQAADLRLIGLLFERPAVESRRQADALAAETRDPALRTLAAGLSAVDEPTYVSLFGPGGPVSPRAAAYVGRQDPARVMAQLAALYDAFAYRARTADPRDHVAVQTDFAAYLWLKEAYALARGQAETAEVTADARKRFLADHLSVTAAGIARRLGTVQAPEFLALAQALLERTGAPPPQEGEVDAPDEPDDLACGLAGPCGDAGGPPPTGDPPEDTPPPEDR